jgi:hypothetical protein
MRGGMHRLPTAVPPDPRRAGTFDR